ncbi:hypothetical protein FNL37_1765 [Methylovorus glucosotrophus]|nr:hypothetical protein FNL37_1765 [Methylovorus glucosotrophus]
MTHIDYVVYKLIGLVLLVFFVHLFYGLITGRTIEEDRRRNSKLNHVKQPERELIEK